MTFNQDDASPNLAGGIYIIDQTIKITCKYCNQEFEFGQAHACPMGSRSIWKLRVRQYTSQPYSKKSEKEEEEYDATN